MNEYRTELAGRLLCFTILGFWFAGFLDLDTFIAAAFTVLLVTQPIHYLDGKALVVEGKAASTDPEPKFWGNHVDIPLSATEIDMLLHALANMPVNSVAFDVKRAGDIRNALIGGMRALHSRDAGGGQ